jgi:hypothetical protein
VFCPRWAAALCVLPCSALAAEGDLRLTAQTGYDSNVRRDYEQTGTVSDGELSLLASGSGRAGGDAWSATGAYDIGVRTFLQYWSEDTLVQAANGEASYAAGQTTRVGVETHDKDRRGGNREYSDFLGGGFIDYAPDEALNIRLRVSGHRFIYWDNFAYTFTAPEVGFSGRYRFDRHHSILFSGSVGLRAYDAATSQAAGDPTPDPRKDTAFTASIGYAYRGPFTASLSYDLFEQDSNSFGQSLTQHRLIGTAAVRLPWHLFLLVEGTLLYTVYPDGIYLSPDFLLSDDENANGLSVKLARPLSEHVDVEAHYGIYHNHLPLNGLTYWRVVGWVGLTWRL